MVEKTLQAMAGGGIHDRISGGFQRYSTDAEWRVPHYEKMLYDQALLARAYAEAYQATHRPAYAETARDTLDYVLREMTSPEGGFYSAQDADSPDPKNPSQKIEGAYYAWNKEERSRHPAPPRDDKILTDWNALMISGFCLAARALDEPRYRDAAVRAGDFIWERLRDKKGRLLHCRREGDSAIGAQLNDTAFLIQAEIDLYETTFEEKWLDRALSLADEMLRRFWDDTRGGFFMTADDAEKLFVRPKEIYDGALPSGNSIAALDLLRLAYLKDRRDLREAADKTLGAFAGEITAEPTGYP